MTDKTPHTLEEIEFKILLVENQLEQSRDRLQQRLTLSGFLCGIVEDINNSAKLNTIFNIVAEGITWIKDLINIFKAKKRDHSSTHLNTEIETTISNLETPESNIE